MNEDSSKEVIASIPIDTVFDLLSDRRRRYLLYSLYRYANPVSLPRIADRVTEWELNMPADTVPKERLRIYMELYHHHIPRLSETGIVEYSQDEDMVELTGAADQLKPHIEHSLKHDTTPFEWSEVPESEDDAPPFFGDSP